MAATNDPRLITLLSDAFDKLQKALLTLKNLPLSIVGAKCTSGFYRRTKPYPCSGITVKYTDHDKVVGEVAQASASGRFPPFLPSMKVLISLERSGKWGDDLEVIAKLKSAFYIDISRRMKTVYGWFSVPTETQLYIIVERIVFSLKIVHQKEIALLSQAETSLSADSTQQNLKPNSAFILRKKLIHKPMLSQQLYGLSQRCPAFAQTCIYVRLWLGWNFLSKMFEGMAIELMVANLFLHDRSVPTSGVAGFSRFVAFLATFDFTSKPLIVDVNNNFPYEAHVEAKENFAQRRPALPPLVIITPEDTDGTIFTAVKPESVVFLRTIKLAKTMHKQICASAQQNQIYSQFVLPIHDTKIYDFLIRLRARNTAIADESNKKQVALKTIQPAAPYLPVVDLEPVKLFVEELRNNFDSAALFFYNAYKPHAIGVVLRPDFVAAKSADKVMGDVGDQQEESNLKTLVDNFKMIGGSMVRDIIVSPQYRKLCGVNFEAKKEN